MADPAFADAGAPPEAVKRPRPLIGDVDSHPDSAFIWAVILETRQACRDATARSHTRAFPYLG